MISLSILRTHFQHSFTWLLLSCLSLQILTAPAQQSQRVSTFLAVTARTHTVGESYPNQTAPGITSAQFWQNGIAQVGIDSALSSLILGQNFGDALRSNLASLIERGATQWIGSNFANQAGSGPSSR